MASSFQIDALVEVVEAVRDRVEVYLDGGIRKGSDVLKALALGAKCVFIGRPALWGLAYKVSKEVWVCIKESQNHRMVGVASPFGSIWSNPYSNRNTQIRVPKATSRWLWKLSKEESPLPLGSPCQRPVHPTSTPEANVKLLCSCNFHVAPGQRPAPLSPASICKTRNRFHTNISPQAACGATFHESLSCSPPRRSSLSVTRRRCARLRQKVGRGSF